MLKKYRKIIINFLYLLFWGFPLFFFIKDFFDIKSIEILNEKYIQDTIFFSIKQGFYSTTISFLVAIFPAYYAGYREDRISKFIRGLVFIPFFFPVISIVTIFSIIFNLPFMKELNILYTLKAIIVANVFYNSPIYVKYISDALRKIPKELDEAMLLDGADEMTIFLRGKLPLILPQIFRAFILVFTYCFLGFGIILSLGGVKYSNIEVEIANTLMGVADFSKAMVLGGVQFCILLILNLFATFIKEYELTGENQNKPLNPLLKIYSIIYLLFQFGIVAFSILFSFYDRVIGKISFKAYVEIFSKKFNQSFPIIESLINSVAISVVVSFISVLLIYLIIKNYNRITDIIIFSNMGISGAFLAITLYYLNVLFDIPLMFLLGVGYLMSVIPVGYSFMYQYIKKFPTELLEACELDCRNSFQKFIYVEFPILKNIFISSFLQVFAIIFGEFTLAYTMQLEDIIPIASLINYSLVSSKKYAESSAFSIIILIVVLGAFLLGEYKKEKE